MKAFMRKFIKFVLSGQFLHVLVLIICLSTLILNTASKPVSILLMLLAIFSAYTLGCNWQRPDKKTDKAKRLDVFPEHLNAILNGISDPVIILDTRALVTYANSAAKVRLPNCQENDPFSFCLRDPAVLEALEKTIISGEPISVHYSERTPIERFYELMISSVQDTSRRGNIIILMRDITRLQRMENTRADFVANASHELRTPLASIIGFIETLQGPAKSDLKAHERFLKIMREQARRMSRLVDDLLSLSRIELTEHVPPKDSVDMISVVKTIIDTLQGLAHERGVKIKLETSSNEPCFVLGDRDELLRVIENLIENAIKYGQSGRRVDVDITYQNTANCIDIAIKDYGEGIEPQHIPRLTERFYRASIDGSREQGGTGLGLAIVKHIVTRHKGTLRIESAGGQNAEFGARFTVSIPILNAKNV